MRALPMGNDSFMALFAGFIYQRVRLEGGGAAPSPLSPDTRRQIPKGKNLKQQIDFIEAWQLSQKGMMRQWVMNFRRRFGPTLSQRSPAEVPEAGVEPAREFPPSGF